MPRILMCPPTYYGIEYEINPWMNQERQADHALAVQQWNDLHSILKSLDVDIPCLQPVQGLPDLVFTANAGMIFQQQVVLSRFRHPQRQGEEQIDEDWFNSAGFQVLKLPEDNYFEGAGDALFCNETLWAGYRLRSDAQSQQEVGRLIGQRVIPMELVNAYYYHLDTCFCPLATDAAIYFPDAFDEYGQRALQSGIKTLIPVAEEEAQSFACNAVVVGNSVVTNSGCPDLHGQLRAHGFNPIATPLSEFVKAGGSAKCLTLRLDGEEAAIWKM